MAKRFSEISENQKDSVKSSQKSQTTSKPGGKTLLKPLTKLDLPKVNQDTSPSRYNEEDEYLSIRLENTSFGDRLTGENTETSMNVNTKRLNKPAPQMKRTTLQEEILFHSQFQNKIPDYFTRKNFDLMRIVEDQVRFSSFNFIQQLEPSRLYHF